MKNTTPSQKFQLKLFYVYSVTKAAAAALADVLKVIQKKQFMNQQLHASQHILEKPG